MGKFRTVFGLLVVVLATTKSQVALGNLSQMDAMRHCRLRTGLKDGDIMSANTRNQQCAIDCLTRQGTLMTAFADEGMPCNDLDGYKCAMGMCRGEVNRLYDESKEMDLHSITLHIKTAHVADRDPYPAQGESDAFVVVEVEANGKPNYNGSELICHTHVVQDSSRPKWNYMCKPLPLSSSAKLRFVVMDSDKPDTQPQLLGRTTQTLETLLNAGPQTLILEHPKLPNGPFWLEVEIKGKRYTPGEQ